MSSPPDRSNDATSNDDAAAGVCGLPTYLMPSAAVAGACGRKAGKSQANKVALVLVVLLALYLLYVWTRANRAFAWRTTASSGWPAILIAVVLAMLAFWLLPGMQEKKTVKEWQAAQVEINALRSSGIPRSEAIRHFQSLAQTKMQTGATLGSGAEIAAAILGSAALMR